MNDITNSWLNYFRSKIGYSMNDSPSLFGQWLNGTVVAVEYGRLVMDFAVRDELTNPAGVLHGGASAAILDDVIGAMVFTLGRTYAYTSVNLNIDFLHAAHKGEVVRVTSEVIREGKNIIHCEGQITSSTNKIIAKCSTNLIQTSIEIKNS